MEMDATKIKKNRAKISFCDEIKTHIRFNYEKSSLYNNNNVVVAIINSCDGLVHAVAKYCNKISSKQTIVLVTLS